MSENPCYYISDLNRLFKRNTSKYNVHKHEYLTYDNGIDLMPKTQSKHRYSIYNKGKEVTLSRNKTYREQFSENLLKDLDFCLRAEVQLKDTKNIKRAFGLGKYQNATFANIFDRNVDVVGEEFGKLFTDYYWEGV